MRSSSTVTGIDLRASRGWVLAILCASLIAAYVPTYIKLAAGPWQTEQEGHGPFIILASAWLAWQCRSQLKTAEWRPALAIGWLVLVGGLLMMIVARVLDVLFFEVLSEIPVVVGSILIVAGWPTLRVLAFPIAFLLFSAPPPGWMLDVGTVPLKSFVSDLVTQILYTAGYPVAQNGVMIMIGSYQLLVKDACAGMNSIFALSAIGIFYVYAISEGSLLRKIILLMAILPITIAANFLRVMALVLIAYYGGIDAVEGVFHEITGIALFVIALLLVFLLDAFLGLIERMSGRSAGRRSRSPSSVVAK